MRPAKPTLKPRAPAGWLRFLAGFLLLQLLGAELWPALHHALFKHAVCAEHGELVHVAAHDDDGAAAPSGATEILAAGADEDAHDHCRLPPGTQQPAAEPDAAALLGIASPPCGAGVLSRDENLPNSIPLLALAPKQSPPS